MAYKKRTVKNQKNIKRKSNTFKKQKLRKSRKSRKLRRGGGWLGPRIIEPDTDGVNIDKLMENNYYTANKDDKTLFDIEHLSRSIELFNAYLKTKQVIDPKTKKIKEGRFANITVLEAKLKKCNKKLRAGIVDTLCIILKYQQQLPMQPLIEKFRMIGPLQIFVNKKTNKLELPFLALLNLLELPFTSSDMVNSGKNVDFLVKHRLGLLVDDRVKDVFNDHTKYLPSEVTKNMSDEKYSHFNEFAEALFTRRRVFKKEGQLIRDSQDGCLVAASPAPVDAGPAPVAASPAPVDAGPAPLVGGDKVKRKGRFVVTTIKNF